MKLRYKTVLLVFVVSLMSISATARPNSRAGMLEVERLLANLGYWILKVDGSPDASTHHAIMAFQKVEGRKRTGTMSPADMKALRLAQRPIARYPTEKAHVEVDLKRQVLFYVDDTGTVSHIIPVSSGNGKRFRDEGQWKVANTPRGLFNVGLKIRGAKKSSLGVLYNPNYFLGGLAIHGSNSIPPFPASHGCVRVPRFADPGLFNLIKMDMGIYLYD